MGRGAACAWPWPQAASPARVLARPHSRPSASPRQPAGGPRSLGGARPGEDGGGVGFPPPSSLWAALATCPGERRLSSACTPAGLAYLISRYSPPNLASPIRQAGFPEPRNASGRQADPWDPTVRAQSLLPGSPRALWRRARPPDPWLNVSEKTRREDQAQASGGGMLSTGSSGPASYRWGEGRAQAAEQQASQLHPQNRPCPLSMPSSLVGTRSARRGQGGPRRTQMGIKLTHFFKVFPPKISGSFTRNVSTVVLENTQGRVGKAFQKKAAKLV